MLRTSFIKIAAAIVVATIIFKPAAGISQERATPMIFDPPAGISRETATPSGGGRQESTSYRAKMAAIAQDYKKISSDMAELELRTGEQITRIEDAEKHLTEIPDPAAVPADEQLAIKGRHLKAESALIREIVALIDLQLDAGRKTYGDLKQILGRLEGSGGTSPVEARAIFLQTGVVFERLKGQLQRAHRAISRDPTDNAARRLFAQLKLRADNLDRTLRTMEALDKQSDVGGFTAAMKIVSNAVDKMRAVLVGLESDRQAMMHLKIAAEARGASLLGDYLNVPIAKLDGTLGGPRAVIDRGRGLLEKRLLGAEPPGATPSLPGDVPALPTYRTYGGK